MTAGLTYYFVLTAYDTSGNESAYSREISKLILSSGLNSGPSTPRPYKYIYYAGIGSYGVWMFIFGIISFFTAGRKNSKSRGFLLVVIAASGILLTACGSGGSGNTGVTGNSVSGSVIHTVSGLNPGTTFYWKVTAHDGNNGTTDSVVNSFSTE